MRSKRIGWLLAGAMALGFCGDGARASVVTTPDALGGVSASFTRPADTTAYAAGDLVANSTSAGSVVPLSWPAAARPGGGCFRVERVVLSTTSTSLTNAQFKVYLFEDLPVPSVGDNAAFDSSGALSTSKVLTLVTHFAVTLAYSGSDGARGSATPATGNGATVCPVAGGTIYGLVEAAAAYTPTSAEVINVRLEGYRP